MPISIQDSNKLVQEIDLQILDLLQKRFEITNQVAEINDLDKKTIEKETKEYQLNLIHSGKTKGLRRTLIRKIFRSIQQDAQYNLNKKVKKLAADKESAKI
jgi:chorismate mutase